MKKPLGFWRTWAIVVGTMVGSGVFLLPSVLAPYGSYSLAGWIIAGGGTLFVALTLGSLARRIPKIGGPYAYTRAAFGDLPAFLIAWGYWISVWAGVAAVAVAFVGYASDFLPILSDSGTASALCAVIMIAILTWVNVQGVRTAGTVQLLTTIMKLLPLVVIAVAGLMLGDVSTIKPANPNNQSMPLLLASVAMLTMWAYVGVEAGTIPADDVEAPSRTIPRALIAGTLTATLVYILATVGVMALVPASELAASESPFTAAATKLFGEFGAKFISVGALVSIAGTLNSLILVTGQVTRAAALDKLFLPRFALLNGNGAPAFALMVSSALAAALVLANYTKGIVAAFTTLALLSTLMVLVPYLVSAAAELVLLRRAGEASGGQGIRASLIAVLALLFAVFAIIGSGLSTVAYGLILLVAGLPVYLWLKSRSGAQSGGA